MKKHNRHQKLIAAELAEAARQFELAERLVLEVISELDPKEDQAMIGALHLNLGSITDRGAQPQNAIRYYLQAITILNGLKGDSILQSAHAHFNLAKIFLDIQDSRALEYSIQALELYHKYPFSDEKDIVDARISVQISKLAANETFKLDEIRQLWADMKKIPFKDLTRRNVETFVIMCASLNKGRNFPNIIDEIRSWADDKFVVWVQSILRKEGL